MNRTENAQLDEQVLRLDRQRYFTLYSDLQESGEKVWLVEGWFGAGEASAVYGAPGAAKSVMVEDLGLRISARWTWHNKPVMGGAVVYVALERAQLVKRRALAFRKKHDLPDLPFAIVDGVHDFRDPKTAELIAFICRQVATLTGEAVVLIIIDTLSRALAGGDENSPKDMGAIVTTVARLQQDTKAHVLLVHHMPHESDRMRGHGALLGAMDTTVHVAKSGGSRVATVVKANDSEEGVSVAFDLESVEIGPNTAAPIVVTLDAPAAMSTTGRRLNDRQRNALTALGEVILSRGSIAPASLDLPHAASVAQMEDWRDEMRRREIITADDPNPRATFQRIRDALQARNVIGVKDGFVWPAA